MVGVVVAFGKCFKESLTNVPDLWCNFRQPDGGLDGLHLAEEGADAVEFVMAPMLEQSGCLG